MDFEKRLERAIQRGERSRANKGREARQNAMNEDELRNIHSQARLDLTEHIEQLLRKLADHFPGFEFKTVIGEEGWGASIRRDDLDLSRKSGSRSVYSRLELLIRPFNPTHIIELTAKGAIRNKETQNRNHYQFLVDVDQEAFKEVIDMWVLEYAEQYAAV